MDIISPSVSPKVINNSFTTAAAVGASIANGTTGTITSSPTALVVGANTITVTGLGDLTITLPIGCNGTAVSGALALVTGSPVSLAPGANSITIAGAPGTITINLTVDNDLVTIPHIQTGYVKRLAVNNPTGGTANLTVKDVYLPDVSNSNPTPTLQVKNRYPIYITAADWIDVNGHTISKHMGMLRITSDTAGVIVGYVLQLE